MKMENRIKEINEELKELRIERSQILKRMRYLGIIKRKLKQNGKEK